MYVKETKGVTCLLAVFQWLVMTAWKRHTRRHRPLERAWPLVAAIIATGSPRQDLGLDLAVHPRAAGVE
jgi:hypothetical protein